MSNTWCPARSRRAERIALAAADHGALLVLDDLHDADDATLRLSHYLARCAVTDGIALVIAHRSGQLPPAFEQFRSSIAARTAAATLELAPLESDLSEQLVRRHHPGAPDDTVTRIVELAGGSPFALVELARRVGSAHPWEQTADTVALAGLDPKSREILQRVAVIGRTFDTDEFVAISDLTDDEAFTHLDAAIAEGVIEHTGASYNFRHGLVRDALIRDVAPHRRRRIHRGVAERLEALGASPARSVITSSRQAIPWPPVHTSFAWPSAKRQSAPTEMPSSWSSGCKPTSTDRCGPGRCRCEPISCSCSATHRLRSPTATR